MKRTELINKLINEGLSEKTLSKLTDNQINILAERMLSDATQTVVKKTVYSPSEVSAAKQKGQGISVKDGSVSLQPNGSMTVTTGEGEQQVSETSKKEVKEKLVGKQKNIDKNHNGKIDAQDFKILKGQKKKEVAEEEKPSAGLSKEKKSEVVKKAKKGEDIGKKGKGFEKIADKAAKKYGSKEKGQKVAAAAMWKNVQKEGNEKNKWVKNLVENEYFHNFTSKGEIMELIHAKLNEVKSELPDFLSSKAIKSGQQQENEPATKPKTKPTTKPGTKPSKPKHNPYNPGPQPNPAPQAEAFKKAA